MEQERRDDELQRDDDEGVELHDLVENDDDRIWWDLFTIP